MVSPSGRTRPHESRVHVGLRRIALDEASRRVGNVAGWESAVNPMAPDSPISRVTLRQLAGSEISARAPDRPRNRKCPAPGLRLTCLEGITCRL
jgi:hypothetical protein